MEIISCYNEFRKDIEAKFHKVNMHSICVSNKKIKGKQHALAWHDDDAKASRVDSKVNDKFCE